MDLARKYRYQSAGVNFFVSGGISQSIEKMFCETVVLIHLIMWRVNLARSLFPINWFRTVQSSSFFLPIPLLALWALFGSEVSYWQTALFALATIAGSGR